MKQRSTWACLVSSCCGIALAGAALPSGAAPHVHGAAQLDVATEPRRISLQLRSPLEALLGFERAPRSAAERRLADTVLARLKAADGLFKVDPAAGCRPGEVEIDADALAPRATATRPGDGHADLEASFSFDCDDASKAAYLDVGLFDAFARMQRIDVQLVTPRGQSKRMLQRPAKRIALSR